MTSRKKLHDIVRQNTDRERLAKLWKTTEAAEERGPLPPGEYTFRILSGELFTSRLRSTLGYKLTLEVTEGEQSGRRTWVDFWLTPDALPHTKRDLAKIGVTSLEQLDQPLPSGILLRGKLARRNDDDGNESNRLVRFECLGIEPEDVFAPKDEGEPPAGADQGATPEPPPTDALPSGANDTTKEGAAP
jgi:hypothetical protein